jgi:hypothetical protein
MLEIARSDGQDARGEFLSGIRVELRSVSKGDAIGLLGHGPANFGHTVANTDDGGLAGGVKIAATFGVNDPTTFAADSDGILFAEIARK